MSHPEPTTPRPVSGILPAARARWLVLLLTALLGLGVGAAAALLIPESYKATTTVRVGAGLVPVGDMNASSNWAQDQAVLAQTQMVLTGIGDQVGQTADEVRSSLSVAQRGTTSYLDFTYSADDAQRAEKGADVAAAAYLETARGEAEQRWQAQIDRIDDLVADTSGSHRADLVAERQKLNQTVVDPGRVIQGAAGQATRATVSPVLLPVAGLLGGLLLGAAVAYLLEARSPRRRDADGDAVESETASDRGFVDLGRLDPSGRALLPVVSRLQQVELPSGRDRTRLAVATVEPDVDPAQLPGVVRRPLRSLGPERRIRTV